MFLSSNAAIGWLGLGLGIVYVQYLIDLYEKDLINLRWGSSEITHHYEGAGEGGLQPILCITLLSLLAYLKKSVKVLWQRCCCAGLVPCYAQGCGDKIIQLEKGKMAQGLWLPYPFLTIDRCWPF